MMKKLAIVGVILMVIFAAGVGFWFVGSQKTGKEEIRVNQENNKKEQEISGEEIDTSNWQTYQNVEYGFEVKYPSNWGVRSKNYRYWESVYFNKAECLTYDDSVCEDEFLSIDISNKKNDNDLKKSSLWSWTILGGICEHRIPVLQFNIDYNIQACEREEMGYKRQGYHFEKGDLHYLFIIRYDDKGYRSPIGKKILETFTFQRN